MKIPETYEEFLELSENEINDISKSNMSLEDAQRMMKFLIDLIWIIKINQFQNLRTQL